MDEEPHTDSVLTNEQIEAIKKSALVNTLNQQYTMAAQADEQQARANMTELQRLRELVEKNKVKLFIYCGKCGDTQQAAFITDMNWNYGCDCCGAGSEPEPEVDVYCTGCYELQLHYEFKD